MKTEYIALIIFLVVVVILLVVFRNKISTAITNKATGDKSQTETTTPAPTQLDFDKLLKEGVKGAEVKRLQQWLGGIAADGSFGQQTKQALYNKKGVYQITLNEYMHVYADLTGAPSDPIDTTGNSAHSGDVINWSPSSPGSSFLTNVSERLFDWFS